MLELIRGRANTGKSQRILEQIRERGSRRGQILLVPDYASYAAEVDLAREIGPTASRYAEVLTFRRLTRRVLAQTGGERRLPLDGGGKILMMQRAFQDVSTALSVYRRPSQKVAFLQGFIDFAEELQRYRVTPENLLEQSQTVGGQVGEKFRDIALVYAAYESRLNRDGSRLADEMEQLIVHLEESAYLDGKDIYLDGFTHFTAQEEAVLEIFLRQAASVTVTLLGEENSRLEIFQAGNRAYERLKELAASCGCRVEEHNLRPSREPFNALEHLERHFFGPGQTWKGGDPCGITIREASTMYGEVEYVAASIRRLVASGVCRYRDIAVTVRNLADYEGIVEDVFARYEVPVYLSRRGELTDKPLAALVLSALAAVSDGFAYEDIFRMLKTGLTGLTEEQCDLLENYVLKWEIFGNMWIREQPWTASPGGYGEPTEEEAAQLEEINAAREQLRPYLAELKEGLHQPGAAEKMTALYRFLEGIGLPSRLRERSAALAENGKLQLAEEYRQLWEILCGVMDQFAEILGDSPLSEQEFVSLVRLVLSQYSVGTIPAALDQVALSELTRNDRHSTAYLFLIGANDHVLPMAGGGGILSEDERDLLLDGGVRLAPYGVEQLQMELQYIYAALAKPTTGLAISYPISGKDGAELRPAFVVGRVRTLVPQAVVFREMRDKEFRLTAPAPALDQVSRWGRGALWSYFAAQPLWEEALAAVERGGSMTRGRLSPEAVAALYGKELRLSASRVDRVRTCHFAYFMEYGLRLRERRKATFDAIEIGTFHHYVLEKVTEQVQREGGFAAVSRERLHQLVRECVRQYLLDTIGPMEEQTARLRYLLRRLTDSVCRVLDSASEELQVSQFVPLSFELRFSDQDGALPAVTIRAKDDTVLHVNGQVDRVDGWVKDDKLYLRVVDYKTGRKSFDLTDIARGMNLQMLIYLFALEKEGKKLYGKDIVPAGVLYFPARDQLLPGRRDTSPEEAKAAMEKELRRSGLVLEDREVLEAMEHDALTTPRFLPLAIDRSGSITKGVATAAQLGSLSRYVDRLLGEIAMEVAGGNITADPWRQTEADTACRFCEFASACHFSEGQGGDHYEQIIPTTPQEFWAAVEEGEEGNRWQS